MKRFLLSLAPLLLAGCAVFHSPPADAGTLTVTWTNPTTNTDGSAIPAAQGQPEALQAWRIEYGTCAAGGSFGTKAGEFTRQRATGGAELTTVTQNIPPGNLCVRVFVANSAGAESDASNVAAKVVDPAKPRPPVQT